PRRLPCQAAGRYRGRRSPATLRSCHVDAIEGFVDAEARGDYVVHLTVAADRVLELEQPRYRNVLGQNLLDLGVKTLPFVPVVRLCRGIEQLVDTRVAVLAGVGEGHALADVAGDVRAGNANRRIAEGGIGDEAHIEIVIAHRR